MQSDICNPETKPEHTEEDWWTYFEEIGYIGKGKGKGKTGKGGKSNGGKGRDGKGKGKEKTLRWTSATTASPAGGETRTCHGCQRAGHLKADC